MPFIIHPADMVVPPTRNSTDVFTILNKRRATPLPPPTPKVVRSQLGDWSMAVLGKGLSNVSAWVGNAVQALALNHATYRRVATDPYMTGPALLLGLLAVIVRAGASPAGLTVQSVLAVLVVWLAGTMALHGAARVLGREADLQHNLPGHRLCADSASVEATCPDSSSGSHLHDSS